jgi:hypothetical protein
VAWLAACEGFLQRATKFFGADKPLEQIRVSDVRAWVAHLLTDKGKTGKMLGAETVRRHLFTLSAVYRFAQEAEPSRPGSTRCRSCERSRAAVSTKRSG